MTPTGNKLKISLNIIKLKHKQQFYKFKQNGYVGLQV